MVYSLYTDTTLNPKKFKQGALETFTVADYYFSAIGDNTVE